VGDEWATVGLNPDSGTTPVSRSDRMKRAFPEGVPGRSAAESGLRGSYDDRLDWPRAAPQRGAVGQRLDGWDEPRFRYNPDFPLRSNEARVSGGRPGSFGGGE